MTALTIIEERPPLGDIGFCDMEGCEEEATVIFDVSIDGLKTMVCTCEEHRL